jgi:hypothetical protein
MANPKKIEPRVDCERENCKRPAIWFVDIKVSKQETLEGVALCKYHVAHRNKEYLHINWRKQL